MYVTISEFAKLAHVSRQAVYLRLDSKEFAKYVKNDTISGKIRKVIDTEALKFYKKNDNIEKNIEKKDCKSCKDENFYQEQLDRKDHLISQLMEQINDLQYQNKQLNIMLIEQGKQLTRLLVHQQQLDQIQQMLLLKLFNLSRTQSNKPQKAISKQKSQKNRFLNRLKK